MTASMVSMSATAVTPEPGWERTVIENTVVFVRPAPSGGSHVVLASPEVLVDADGHPRCSATFVCRKQPDLATQDGLRSLIEYATIGLELTTQPAPGKIDRLNTHTGSSRPAPVARSEFIMRGPGGNVLSRTIAGRGQSSAALAVTLSQDNAVELLDSLTGSSNGIGLEVVLEWQAPPGGLRRQWQTNLADVSRFLDTKAGDDATFYAADLEAYLSLMIEEGIVTGDGAHPGAIVTTTAAFLRAATPILSRLDDDDRVAALGARFALRPWPSGEIIVRFQTRESADAPPMLTLRDGLTDVLQRTGIDLLSPSITRFVAHDGKGRILPLNVRIRSPRGVVANKGPANVIARGDRLVSLSAAIRPAAVLPLNPALSGIAQAHMTMVPGFHAITDLTVAGQLRSLPVIAGDKPPPWKDRKTSKRRWYLPEFRLAEGVAGAAHPGFLFRFRTVGHDLDGRPGLEATVAITLEIKIPDNVQNAITALPDSVKVTAVPIISPAAYLDIPFRDENGQNKTEAFPASELVLEKRSLKLVFAFTDRWARIAYGALAYEGYQAQPANLRIEYLYEAYLEKQGLATLQLVSGAKRVGIDAADVSLSKSRSDFYGYSTLRLRDGSSVVLSGSSTVNSSSALFALPSNRINTVKPPTLLQLRPELKIDTVLSDVLARVDYIETKRLNAQSTHIIVPCNTYGQSYAEEVEAGNEPITIACQPAFQLGETPHRIYEAIELPPELRSACLIFRVLSSPDRFVIIPSTFTITRFGSDDGDRAYQPSILLFSTIDIDSLEKSRCVIACTLSADMNAADLVRVADFLRRNVHPNAILEPVYGRATETEIEWALPAGMDSPLQLDIETVETPSGFETSVSTDAFGLPQVAAIIRSIGITGSAKFALSDGTTARATLRLDLGRINGPAPDGPVAIEAADDVLTVRNQLPVAVSVNSLLNTNEAGLVVEERNIGITLEPGATHTLDSGHSQWSVDAVVHAAAELPEIRTFAEDITVSVLIVNNLAGVSDEDRITLTARMQSTDITETIELAEMQEQIFVLPLTVFLANPALELRITIDRNGSQSLHGPVTWDLGRDGYLLALTNTLFGLTEVNP